MDEEKEFYFRLHIIVCSITIAVELFLLIWSNVQVAGLNINSSNIVQLAGKAEVSFATLLFGSWATTSVSLIFPQIRVVKLYRNLVDFRHINIATIFYVLYWVVPIANTLYSIAGGFPFLNAAGISLFRLIASLL